MARDASKTEFDRMRAALQSVAKSRLAPAQVDKVFDGSKIKHASSPTASGKMATPGNSVGFLGEQKSYHSLQQRGEVVLYDKYEPNSPPQAGVSSAFRGVNQRGPDSVSIGLAKGSKPTLFINDNKAYAKEGPVSRASTFRDWGQTVKNTAQKLQTIAQDERSPPAVKAAANFGLKLIKEGRVEARITNDGGNSTASTVPNTTFGDSRLVGPGGKPVSVAYQRGCADKPPPNGAVLAPMQLKFGQSTAFSKAPASAPVSAASAISKMPSAGKR
jgi:hypothetical protein